jgi:16S rRNA (adenine(1408)-N(1))-methyltransferase
VIIDLGTGDGRAVTARAAEEPASIVVGIDAAAAAMADVSRRAARSPRKGGLPNALFVAAAATDLSPVFDGAADLVTVTFPWGSLLRGVVGLDEAVATSVARLPRAGGSVVALVSITERDGIGGLPRLAEEALERIRCGHETNGLRLTDGRPATRTEILATRSSWGRRLLAGSAGRPVWRLTFDRTRDGGEPPAGNA